MYENASRRLKADDDDGEIVCQSIYQDYVSQKFLKYVCNYGKERDYRSETMVGSD